MNLCSHNPLKSWKILYSVLSWPSLTKSGADIRMMSMDTYVHASRVCVHCLGKEIAQFTSNLVCTLLYDFSEIIQTWVRWPNFVPLVAEKGLNMAEIASFLPLHEKLIFKSTSTPYIHLLHESSKVIRSWRPFSSGVFSQWLTLPCRITSNGYMFVLALMQ